MTNLTHHKEEEQKFDEMIKPICDGFDEWCKEHSYDMNHDTASVVRTFMEYSTSRTINTVIEEVLKEIGEDEKVTPPTLIGKNYDTHQEPQTYWKAGQNQERARLRSLLTSLYQDNK